MLKGGFQKEKRVFTDALEREQMGQGSEICADITWRKPLTNIKDQTAS